MYNGKEIEKSTKTTNNHNSAKRKSLSVSNIDGKLECLIDKFCENENISLSVNSLKCERLTKNTKTVFGKDNLKIMLQRCFVMLT